MFRFFFKNIKHSYLLLLWSYQHNSHICGSINHLNGFKMKRKIYDLIEEFQLLLEVIYI